MKRKKRQHRRLKVNKKVRKIREATAEMHGIADKLEDLLKKHFNYKFRDISVDVESVGAVLGRHGFTYRINMYMVCGVPITVSDLETYAYHPWETRYSPLHKHETIRHSMVVECSDLNYHIVRDKIVTDLGEYATDNHLLIRGLNWMGE